MSLDALSFEGVWKSHPQVDGRELHALRDVTVREATSGLMRMLTIPLDLASFSSFITVTRDTPTRSATSPGRCRGTRTRSSVA